jgi:hypothetical protein
MRTKVTLVLIFLNVALFFFIFKFERTWRTEAASREARRLVLGAEAANIRTLELTTTAPGGGFRLVRERDAWFITKPLDRWPANPHAVSAMLHSLELLEHETSFAVADLPKNNQTIADFGLEKPRLTVTFTSGESAVAGAALLTTVVHIGDATPDGKRLYLLSPDRARIHVVNRTLADSLSVPPEQLRSDALFAVRVFEAKSLGVQIAPRATDAGAAGVRVRIRREGTRWMFDAPISAKASRTALELAISELNALRAKSFPAANAAPAPSATPALRIALEGNNRLETLFLGDPVAPPPGPAAPRPAGPGSPAATTEFYAQLEGRRALFTVEVPAALLDVLRNAQETLREKHILEFDAASVTAIALAAPVQPNLAPCELKRIVDTPAAPAPRPAAGPPTPPAPAAAPVAPPAPARDPARDWQIVRRGDGAASPRTFPADPAMVQRLLGQLTALRALTFKSDALTSADLEGWGFNRPIREITLTLSGAPAPLVLRLGTDAGRNVYARVGTPTEPGNSVYQVAREILDELPLNPSAWRDRAVTDPLPAAARISGLRLTDLESKAVVAETTFQPSGEPVAAPRDPAALKVVVSSLRALRAKEYLPGPFTERVTAAGDDRPWRFLLEATIAVPGSAGAEQTSTLALLLTERLGGAQQYAGLKDLDTVFALEQPLVDALWALTYGPRDPGPPPEKKP